MLLTDLSRILLITAIYRDLPRFINICRYFSWIRLITKITETTKIYQDHRNLPKFTGIIEIYRNLLRLRLITDISR